MSDFAKGPWYFGESVGGASYIYSRDRQPIEPNVKVSKYKRTKQRIANVTLISAAPELLEALEAFHAAAKSWHECHHSSAGIQCDRFCDNMKFAEAAIKKARGQQ
jgi:hypothetical protein